MLHLLPVLSLMLSSCAVETNRIHFALPVSATLARMEADQEVMTVWNRAEDVRMCNELLNGLKR